MTTPTSEGPSDAAIALPTDASVSMAFFRETLDGSPVVNVRRVLKLARELDAAQRGEGGLPPILSPLPTQQDVRDAIDRALDDAAKAVTVLSTVLRVKNQQGYMVADEILGSIAQAKKLLATQQQAREPFQNQCKWTVNGVRCDKIIGHEGLCNGMATPTASPAAGIGGKL